MNKPYVICHMMATIDGKITSGTGVDILGNFFDLYTQTEDQLQGDSWMLGRITMEMFADGAKSELTNSNESYSDDYIENKSDNGYMIGIDTKGVLRWSKNTVKLSNFPHELPIAIIVSKATPISYLGYLQKMKINYIFGGESDINFELVMSKLSNLGIKRLLLEGGGNINGSVMAENLIDEVSLMVIPAILNRSEAPTIMERETEDITLKMFKLSSVAKLDKDCAWLRYIK